MKEVTLHTDGSCSGNPGPGGWAAILVYKRTEKELAEKELTGSARETTSARMEMRAVIEGLRALKEPCRVRVKCDAQWLVNAFNKSWIEQWRRREWLKENNEPPHSPESVGDCCCCGCSVGVEGGMDAVGLLPKTISSGGNFAKSSAVPSGSANFIETIPPPRFPGIDRAHRL